MEKAETEKAAFEIEERRKQELEKIAKENEEKNKIAQNEIARQQALIEKLEKEKRDKEALEELAKKAREDERRKKIEEAIKAKDEKINELINNFKQKYESNIAKLQKRLPGYDKAVSFFVTIDRVFSYLLNQISGKMNSVQLHVVLFSLDLKKEYHMKLNRIYFLF
jgi:transposase